MADAQDKQQQRDRYLRAMKHLVDRGEQERRKSASRQRRADRRNETRQRGEWSEDDETFEKIRSTPTGGRVPVSKAVDPNLPRAVVAAVHHGRAELDNGEAARIAPHLAVDPTFRLAVGDEVAFSSPGGQPRVEAVLERRSYLARPDPGNPNRELVLAANVDTAVVVVATKNPPLRPGLIDRFLLALQRGGSRPAICVNKLDLLDPAEQRELDRAMAPYRELEIPVFPVSALSSDGLDALRGHLAATTCVFVGHSGVGKSSILNAIDPEGDRATGDVRDYDGRGRHTTSWSSLRELGDGTRVIDTPGVRAFGLDRIDAEQVRAGFEDFVVAASGCRFGDCSHVQEPDCGVRAAVEKGVVSRARYESYQRILASL